MGTRLAGFLADAAELERRDAEIAEAIDRVAGIAERVATVRSRAAVVGDALHEHPARLAANEGAQQAALVAEHDATAALAEAERRVASLEGSRRRRDELDQALRELNRARDDLADAGTRRSRLDDRRRELELAGRALRAESDRLQEDAATLARDLSETPGLTRFAAPIAGEGLAGIDAWGGHARGALVVARAGLETERERLVTEANMLAVSVLGEPLGATSVTLVRRRLEQASDPGTHP